MRPAYRQRSRPPRRIKFKDVTADQVVPRFIALPQTLNDPWLDLQEFLVGVHGRIRRIDPAIGRISLSTMRRMPSRMASWVSVK